MITHPFSYSYVSFNSLITSPYVIKKYLPSTEETEIPWTQFFGTGAHHGSMRNYYQQTQPIKIKKFIPNKNPENYLKPLDVVWVKKIVSGNIIHHIGIYLGNDNVFHYSGDDKKQYEAKIKITSWNKFVEGSSGREILAYHPIIPFKNYEQIAQQIDWANNNSYWEGRYCLANNNCEHRDNSFIYGINYSKQVQERSGESVSNCQFWRGKCWGDCKIGIANNNKSSINLSNEISQTNNQLKKSTGYWYNKILLVFIRIRN